MARILFDEAHSEAWTIRPEVARAMQPAHPGDASYAMAAASLARHGFEVDAHTEGALDAEALGATDLVMIAHPSDPAWERTTGVGDPRLSPAELDAIEAFVAGGGGLVVLGETEQAKYGNNLNDLLDRFGIHLENETVQDYEHNLGAPSWVLAELQAGARGRGGDLLAGVHRACLYRATTIATTNGARVLARAHPSASAPNAPLVVCAEYGSGRVVVLADSDLFGDDCLAALDHETLLLNIANWTAGRAQPATEGRRSPGPAWERLRDETDALALLQAPDGSLTPDADRDRASNHVEAIAAALNDARTMFEHQAEYLALAAGEIQAWAADGFGPPDASTSLDAFRPEQRREDGTLHLAFFPMYKQNGSRDTCYEALVVRTPWPAPIAALERTRFDNPKFLPVQLLDATRGYRESECAVLFPETVSVVRKPTANHFGAIFCDREAERLRRVGGAAVDLLALNLPPDCARMLADPELTERAYILWDLMHDRAHSHGELPFDPFMIRQRAPYWMYSLEELRCDLTAFTQADELTDTVPELARHVQQAILLDRLLRFPITGTRRRNYDGLGGQLLFAHLHRHDYLRWVDNRLTIEWDRVGEGVRGLHDEIAELYCRGIDRTKLGHWAAAHDLVASRVPPAASSRWTADKRALDDGADPRTYIDLVLDDEFPLSIFYTSLKAKCSPTVNTAGNTKLGE
jgi:Family of unknown function (DUF6421)